MSRSSFASFHLTGIKPSSGKMMTSSVDRLFENEGDVFISSNYNDFNQGLPSIQETASVQSKSPEPSTAAAATASGITNSVVAAKSLIEQQNSSIGGRDSPSTTPSTAKSSRRDSLSERVVLQPPPNGQPLLPATSALHQQHPVVMHPTNQQPPQVMPPPKLLPPHVMENAGTSVHMKNR